MPTEEQNNVIDLGVLEDNPNPLELAQSPTEQELSDQLSQETLQATEGVADIDVGGFEDEIARLMGEAGQEGQFRSAVQQELGIPQEQQTLRDLSRKLTAQRLGLGSALNRAELEAIGTGETKQFFGGKEARIRRESAIDTNTTAAQMLGVQGNIEAAISLADRAVDAKFEPLKRELEVAQFNLERADKYMSGAEKKLAAAKKQELDFQLNELENERTLEKDRTSGIFGVAERAQQNGAPSSLIQKVTAAKTPEEALALAGGFGVSIGDRLTEAKLKQLAAESGKSPSVEELRGTVDAMKLIAEIELGRAGESGRGGGGLVGSPTRFVQGKASPFATKGGDFKQDVKKLQDMLTLENLNKMTGVLTDKDIEILRNAATNISVGMTKDAFDDELTRVKGVLAADSIISDVTPYTVNEDGTVDVNFEISNEEFFSQQ